MEKTDALEELLSKVPFSGSLPIGTYEYIKELLTMNTQHNQVSLEMFFSLALVPFYDPMWNGLEETAGHIIYRLSDFVFVEERERIAVYPSEKASIIITDEELGSCSWCSLQDWRREWEKYHPIIPEFQKMLPSETYLAFEVPK